MRTDDKVKWFSGLILLAVIVIGGIIEPCDGHSCDAEVIQHD